MKTKDEILARKRTLIKDGLEWVSLSGAKDAMEEYARENLREELIGFRNYFNNECYGSIEAWIIDEYIKQKQ